MLPTFWTIGAFCCVSTGTGFSTFNACATGPLNSGHLKTSYLPPYILEPCGPGPAGCMFDLKISLFVPLECTLFPWPTGLTHPSNLTYYDNTGG